MRVDIATYTIIKIQTMFDGLSATIRAQTTKEQRKQAYFGFPILILSAIVGVGVAYTILAFLSGWPGMLLSAVGFIAAFDVMGRIGGWVVNRYLGENDE